MASEAFDLNLIPSVSPFMRHAFAIFWSRLPLNISIIRSITLQAFMSPCCISSFSCSFARSVSYFLFAISYWKLTWCLIIGTRPSVSGLPFATASIFTPKVSSSFVFLYKRFLSASTSAPFLSSKTILIPSFDDWLVMSTISVVAFDSTSE